MLLTIEKGNIIYCDTDAVVLPANSKLKEGSGTSRAIYEAAGRSKLREACSKIKIPIEVGMAVPTSGYNLKANFIIHAIVPKWKNGRGNEYELLSSAYRSTLEVADRMKCRSIAFPLLAAGNNGFDRGLAFEIAVESIKDFEAVNLEEVKLVIYDEEIAVFIQAQGYDVINRFTVNEKSNVGKRIVSLAKDCANDAIRAGLEYMEDEKNRKMILENGIKVAKLVFELKTGKRI